MSDSAGPQLTLANETEAAEMWFLTVVAGCRRADCIRHQEIEQELSVFSWMFIEWTEADVVREWNNLHWEIEGKVDLSKNRSVLPWTLVMHQRGKTNPCKWW